MQDAIVVSEMVHLIIRPLARPSFVKPLLVRRANRGILFEP